MTSILISPLNMYIDTLILPAPQYHHKALDRAFSPKGRMSPITDIKWSGGYSFNPFKFRKTEVDFEFSRRNILSSATAAKGSNICAAYAPNLQESLINGVLQGRKQFAIKGGSALCNARMSHLVYQLLVLLGKPVLSRIQGNIGYKQLKGCGLLQDRSRVKDDVRRHALKGWIRNAGDDFELPWK